MKTVSVLKKLKRASALTPVMLTLFGIAVPALANPLGGDVVSGDASFSEPDPATLQIDQTTDKAIIEWQSFDIDVGETTIFVQPSTESWTLNRVVGS
ncbi:MAG: hypothetical protein MI921_10835, partial [Cytophagales bacterium]|nr:hypothetical protein [Cytophagales bacterium]